MALDKNGNARFVTRRSEGGARTAYSIPGCDGMGGWRFEKILPPSSPSPPAPKIRRLVKNAKNAFKKSGGRFCGKQKKRPCGHTGDISKLFFFNGVVFLKWVLILYL